MFSTMLRCAPRMLFRVADLLAAEFDERSWQITAQYRFGYAHDNTHVYWVNGAANYLIVRR